MRTVLGFAALAVAVCAAVFWSTWTLYYWQGWLYLLAFFGSAAAITPYLWWADPSLLERRVSGGPLAERHTNQRIIQSVASLAFYQPSDFALAGPPVRLVERTNSNYARS